MDIYNWNNMPNNGHYASQSPPQGISYCDSYNPYTPNSYSLSLVPETSMAQLPIIVPQKRYVANIQRNYTRSIQTVHFYVNGTQGIRLTDAQAHNFRGLESPDDRLLAGFGVKVTYRIEWPGYTSFNRQKHALRATREKQSITRAKMAVHVAEVMKDFIEENATLDTTDPTWRVGSHGINLGDLYLLEIHQVAKASLQPVIAYRPSNQAIWG